MLRFHDARTAEMKVPSAVQKSLRLVQISEFPYDAPSRDLRAEESMRLRTLLTPLDKGESSRLDLAPCEIQAPQTIVEEVLIDLLYTAIEV
jgi:hypothetical protein